MKKFSSIGFTSLCLAALVPSALGCMSPDAESGDALPGGFSVYEGSLDKAGAIRGWLRVDAATNQVTLHAFSDFDCPASGRGKSCPVGDVALSPEMAPYAAEILQRIGDDSIIFDVVVVSGLSTTDEELAVAKPSVVLTNAYRAMIADGAKAFEEVAANPNVNVGHGMATRGADGLFYINDQRIDCVTEPYGGYAVDHADNWWNGQVALASEFALEAAPTQMLATITASYWRTLCVIGVAQVYAPISDVVVGSL